MIPWKVIDQTDPRTGESGYAIVTDRGIFWCGKDEASAKAIAEAHTNELAEVEEYYMDFDNKTVQFLRECDEGKHPLSKEDEEVLDRSRPELFRKVKEILPAQQHKKKNQNDR